MRSQSDIPRAVRVIPWIVGALLLAGCASDERVDAGSVSPTEPELADLLSDLPDVSIQGDCAVDLPGLGLTSLLREDGGFIEPQPLSYSLMDRSWMVPSKIVSVEVEAEQPWLRIVRLAGEVGGRSTGDVDVRIGQHELVAIIQSLDGGPAVQLAVTEAEAGPYGSQREELDYVAGLALVESKSGPIVAGNCGSQLESALRSKFQEAYELKMTQLVAADSRDEVIELLGETELLSPDAVSEEDPASTEDGNLLLNPASTSDEVLSKLNEGLLVISTDESLDIEGLICTRTSVGWNDCVPPELEALSSGVDLNIYIDDAGVLDVFLLPVDLDLRNPPEPLASLKIDAETLRTSDLTAIRLHISGTSTSDAQAELRAVEDLAKVDLENSTDWAPLRIE